MTKQGQSIYIYKTAFIWKRKAGNANVLKTHIQASKRFFPGESHELSRRPSYHKMITFKTSMIPECFTEITI